MKVTVLLTTYNHEKYIAQALDTVLMQETEFDYEIVVLEDCSTDRTRDILLSYQMQYPGKIRLRLAERNEPTNSRPFAEEFQASSSPYIAMLDGDDYWTSSKKLEKQVEFLEAHPDCVLCFHNAIMIYEDGRVPGRYNGLNQKPFSVLEDLWQYCFIASATPMLRKNVLDKFPEWYYTTPVGDWPLYMLCAQHGQIGYMDEILAVYRIHGEGIWSKQNKIQKLESLIAIYESMNANLGFRYNGIVQSRISKWKNDLEIAKRVEELAAAVLPREATVIVISAAHEDLPQLGERKVWPFPERTSTERRNLFASGAAGSKEVAWIGDQGLYQFCLYGGPARDTLLASVFVAGKRAALTPQSLGEKPTRNKAFIAATPNPVPTGSGPGKIVISWSTGDCRPGAVYVSVEDQRVHYPANGSDTIKEMEQLHSKGAEFLLVPYNSSELFKQCPELKEHLDKHYQLLISEEDTCLIYDLREALQQHAPDMPKA
jgi:glycosyltransferase involved in cell wall biosynthesis